MRQLYPNFNTVKELVGKSLSTLGKNIDLSQEEFVNLGLPFIETWKIFSKAKDEFLFSFHHIL